MNKSKPEMLQDQVRVASMQRLHAEHIRSHFGVEQYEPHTVVGTSDVRWNPGEVREQRRRTWKRWKSDKLCTTTHCKIRCSCVSRAHARPPKEAWTAHSSINAASSEVTLGKEMLREETYPEEERTGAGEAM